MPCWLTSLLSWHMQFSLKCLYKNSYSPLLQISTQMWSLFLTCSFLSALILLWIYPWELFLLFVCQFPSLIFCKVLPSLVSSVVCISLASSGWPMEIQGRKEGMKKRKRHKERGCGGEYACETRGLLFFSLSKAASWAKKKRQISGGWIDDREMITNR